AATDGLRTVAGDAACQIPGGQAEEIALTLLRQGLRVARAIFTPLSLVVIAVVIWQSRATLGRVVQQGDWHMLAVALALWMSSHLLAPLVSISQARSCGM